MKVNQPAPRDGTVTIECNPDAAPKPTYEWYHGDNKITTGGRYTIHEDGGLEIVGINDDDGGKYKCVANNSLGSDFSVGSLVIKGEYSFTTKGVFRGSLLWQPSCCHV